MVWVKNNQKLDRTKQEKKIAAKCTCQYWAT